jgi:accessory colonization factor AcfC
MNVYIVEYDSPQNVFRGFVVIRADDLTTAQDKFFQWLKTKDSYSHLWQLSFKIIGDDHKPFTVIE